MSPNSQNHLNRARGLAIAAGFATVLQSRVNGGLALEINSGFAAALISFSVGFILLSGYALLHPPVRTGVLKVFRSIGQQLKWWQVVGGTIGASFVAVQSLTVPLVGVAVFTISTIAAQSGNALLVDRFGIGPTKIKLSSHRFFAALLAILGVGVAVANRFGAADFPRWAVLAALAVGGLVAVQHALNGRVRAVADNPFSTAWLNFFFGTSALGLINLANWDGLRTAFTQLPLSMPWLFFGGAFGVFFIVIAAAVIRVLGSLQFTLATTAGQLFGSLLLDLVSPLPGAVLSWNLLIGLSITGIAVMLASRNPETS